MALGGFNTGGNSTYLTIGIGVDEGHKNKQYPKGKPRAVVGRKAQKGDPGAVQVFNADGTPSISKKTGEEVYRTEFAFIEGVVTKIERADSDFGANLNISMVDLTGDSFTLQLKRGKDYWIDFALRCEDIDWSRPVKFSPYSIPDEKDPKYSNRHLVPSQGGAKVMKKWKISWMRELPTEPLPSNEPPPYTYDVDEAEWKKGKTLNWLDAGPIQRAIDKVAFLNVSDVPGDEPPMDEHPNAPPPELPPDQVMDMDDMEEPPY